MSESLKQKIREKAQLPRKGFARELHRKEHFVITLDFNGKIELTEYPSYTEHILVNPWFDDVVAVLDEATGQIQKQITDLRKPLGQDFQTAQGFREAQAEALEWVLAILNGDNLYDSFVKGKRVVDLSNQLYGVNEKKDEEKRKS